MSRNLVIGFLLLPIGVVLTPILPELGVPLILISTRFLQEKYDWARKLNVWVDAKYSSVKAGLRRLRKK